MKIHCINVVWGIEYVRLFLDYSLPLQLTPGNLGALKGIGKYRIFTTEEDKKTIEEDPIFTKLCNHVEVEFIKIEFSLGENKISSMNGYHSSAIQEAGKEGAALIFLCPDILLSDGIFEQILSEIRAGKRAIAILSIRVQKETFCSSYDSQHPGKKGLSSRELVQMALRNLHPLSQALIWNQNKIYHCPSHLYWKMHGECILARGFHLHPIFVWPENPLARPNISIDFDYLSHACPSIDQWKVIEDSDEMAVFEMSGHALTKRVGYMRASISLVGAWAAKHTAPLHHFFIKKKICIHASDLPAEYSKISKESDEVIEKILKEAQNPSKSAAVLWFFYRVKNKIIRSLKAYV